MSQWPSEEMDVATEPGRLALTCRESIFAEIRDAIWKAARLERFPIRQSELVDISISNYKEPPSPPTWLGYLWLFGCGLVAAALLFVFGIGVSTIVGWMRPAL